MASLSYEVKLPTRPCVFWNGEDLQNGIWHMWYVPIGGRFKDIVVGIIEDESGNISFCRFDDIVLLDSTENFQKYDFDYLRKRQKDVFDRMMER